MFLRSALGALGSSFASIASPSIPAKKCNSAKEISWPNCSNVSRQQRSVGIMASTSVPSTSKMKTSALVQAGSAEMQVLCDLEGSLRTTMAPSSPLPFRAQHQRLDEPQRHQADECDCRNGGGNRRLVQPLFDRDVEIAHDS